MATFPTSKIDLHKWVNTISLAGLAFVGNKYYSVAEKTIDAVHDHEVRISVLEDNRQSQKQTSYFSIAGILQDRIKVESE